MKTIEHDKRPSIDDVRLKTNPFCIWLTSTLELVIEEGDRLDQVAETIKEYKPFNRLRDDQRREVVAYWFALGEREHVRHRKAKNRLGSPWTEKELRTNAARRYLS